MIRTLSCLGLITISLFCAAQNSSPKIKIEKPSVEAETSSVWCTINDYNFLESQGYQIHLPKGDFIDSLIAKSKAGKFGNEDYSSIFRYLEDEVFNMNEYDSARVKVENRLEKINTLVSQLIQEKKNWNWYFKTFESYPIVFTLYGTGGSYDPDTGTITILTNRIGNFMRYQDPTNTIIHEITHMGIEYSIVQKYNLEHRLNERIVDTIVYLLFNEELPNYRIQSMGDTSIDALLKNKESLIDLDSLLNGFLDKRK